MASRIAAPRLLALRIVAFAGFAFACTVFIAPPAVAADMTGVTATAIKVGNTMPYSGPAAPYGTIGKAAAAYFAEVNAAGGVAGHRIDFISLDDGYNPAKAVEQTRKLVEEDGVAFVYGSVGTATNLSVRQYLNDHKVPQLGILSGAGAFLDPVHFPYSMGGIASYVLDGRMVAAYLLKHKPDAKVAVLNQNDDFGRDHVRGLKLGLGDKAGMIVKEASFEVTDPTVDSQVVALQASGADVLYIAGIPRGAAQAIRKADELGWKPLRFLTYTASPVGATLTLAGLDKSTGIISHNDLKDPQDPSWKDDPEMKAYIAWMNKSYPQPDIKNGYIFSGWVMATSLVAILQECHGDFSRENVMKTFTHLDHLKAPGYLPGITLTTGPADYESIQSMRNMRFDGTRWVLMDE